MNKIREIKLLRNKICFERYRRVKRKKE